MKRTINIIISLLLICMLEAFAQNNNKKMPQLNDNQLWISSVPLGLDVYMAPLDRLIINPEKILEDKWAKLYDRENQKVYFDDQKYYKGKTPILINNVDEGEYIIAFGPIEFWSRKYNDPTLEKIAEVSSVPLIPENFPKLEDGTLIQEGLSAFYIKKETHTAKSIILMNIKDYSLENMNKLYPDSINYNIDREKLKTELLDNNLVKNQFNDQDLNNAIDFFERGGKVCYTSKNNVSRLIIEIKGNNEWEIYTQIKPTK